MADRVVSVETPGSDLRLRTGQVEVRRDGEAVGQVPVEDLGILVLGSATRVTTGVLDAVASRGGAVLICNQASLPSAVVLPLAGNGLHAERLRRQIALKAPVRKRLWARIVRAKVLNQALALPSGHPARQRLRRLAAEVRSGDPGNVEAQAARAYWTALFEGVHLPEAFVRARRGPPPNGLLNYGYAILRAALAREVCAAGLHPAVGLHHHSRYNSFALVDDLLEPLRPVVDLEVVDLAGSGQVEVDSDSKRRLVGLLTQPLRLGGQKRPFEAAVREYVASLLRVVESSEGTAAERAKALAIPGPAAARVA